MQPSRNLIIFLALFMRREEERDSNANFFSQDILGLRVAAQLVLIVNGMLLPL
jgi:hypothetical protein